jgi:hypothetical protein
MSRKYGVVEWELLFQIPVLVLMFFLLEVILLVGLACTCSWGMLAKRLGIILCLCSVGQ